MFGDQSPHSDIQCDKDNSWECERPTFVFSSLTVAALLRQSCSVFKFIADNRLNSYEDWLDFDAVLVDGVFDGAADFGVNQIGLGNVPPDNRWGIGMVCYEKNRTQTCE